MRGKICILRKYIILVLLFIFLLGVSFSSIASIQVSTLIIDLDISAGEGYKGSFQVINNGTKSENVRVYLGDWKRNPKRGEKVFFKAGRLPGSLARWIDYSPSEFELPAGTNQNVKFTITVPKEAEGTQWAMFFVEGEPSPIGSGEIKEGRVAAISTIIRWGIQIYQTDSKTAYKDGKITSVDIESSNPDKDDLIVKVTFQNTGNTRLRPTGRVEIRNEMGDTVNRIDIDYFPILPGDKSSLELTLPKKNLPVGKYIALAIIDFGGDYLVAGQRVFGIGKD